MYVCEAKILFNHKVQLKQMYIKDLQNPKKGNARTETNRRMIRACNKEEELIKHKEISPHN